VRVPYARFTAALFSLLLFAFGCSTVSVHTDHASGIDFSAYKTFAQAPAPKSAGPQLPGYSEITGDHIQAAIAHALEVKGLTKAGPDDADLIVSFAIDGQARQDLVDDGGMYGYGGLGYGDTYTVSYTEGTLTIDLFDAKSKKLVWHAYGQTKIYGSDNADSAKVDGAVADILKKFPPEAK
jgi:hypothetical protein